MPTVHGISIGDIKPSVWNFHAIYGSGSRNIQDDGSVARVSRANVEAYRPLARAFNNNWNYNVFNRPNYTFAQRVKDWGKDLGVYNWLLSHEKKFDEKDAYLNFYEKNANDWFVLKKDMPTVNEIEEGLGEVERKLVSISNKYVYYPSADYKRATNDFGARDGGQLHFDGIYSGNDVAGFINADRDALIKTWESIHANIKALGRKYNQLSRVVFDVNVKNDKLKSQNAKKLEAEKKEREFSTLNTKINQIDKRISNEVLKSIEDLRADFRNRNSKINEDLLSMSKNDAQTIQELNEALMNNTTENIKLSEDVSKLDKSFTALNKSYSKLQSDVSKIYDVSARLDNLSKSFSTQKKDVSKLVKAQNESNIRYAKEQANIRAGIEQTNAVVAQTSKKADALKTETDKLQEQLAGIEKQQEGILQDLNVSREGLARSDDAFKTFHNETIRKYNALQKQSDAMSRQLEDKNKGFQQATEELKLAQDKQNAEVAKLKQSASEHQQRTEQRMKEINKFVELNRSTLEKQGVDLQNLRETFKKDTETLKTEIGKQFKTVFDEKAHTNRIIQKQNKQTTTFKQLRRPMPDKARAFRLLRRGRYALLEDVI